MGNQETRIAIAKKAIKGGFKFFDIDKYQGNKTKKGILEFSAEMIRIKPEIIFDHGFAKAFWIPEPTNCYVCPKCGYATPYSKHSEETHCSTDGRKLVEKKIVVEDEEWRGHLQQMVLEEEPIKFLRNFCNTAV